MTRRNSVPFWRSTAIVWGLAFSTLLTLVVIPLLYRVFMSRSRLVRGERA